MFLLAVLEDTLRILPEQFDRDSKDVLIEQIDHKYSNKVLLEVGLCISFYDFLHVEDAFVYPAEGSCHQVVKFRLIVYRPFVGETLQGKVVQSDASGIKVSMGFFDDIHIPARNLRQPASFNPDKSLWTWHYHGDPEESSEDQDLVINVGGEIRFAVADCVFTLVTNSMRERRVTSSTSSSSYIQSGSLPVSRRDRSSSNVSISDDRRAKESGSEEQPAMQLIGDISSDDGLGMNEWWG
eukprot:GSChrysophyteH1.ASY1.ANO1.701.1 assembled CDS